MIRLLEASKSFASLINAENVKLYVELLVHVSMFSKILS